MSERPPYTVLLPLPERAFLGTGVENVPQRPAFPLSQGAMERFSAALARWDDAGAALVCRSEPALTLWIALHRPEGFGTGDDFHALVDWLRATHGAGLRDSLQISAATCGTIPPEAWDALRRLARHAADAACSGRPPLPADALRFQTYLMFGNAWLLQAGVQHPSRRDPFSSVRETLQATPAGVEALRRIDAGLQAAQDSLEKTGPPPPDDGRRWAEELAGALAPTPPEIAALAAPPESLLEALGEFSAGAGHEINNPLATIAGRAELLARGEADPGRRRDLAAIQAQALRAHEMITDLMTFARPPTPQPEEFSLGPWLAEKTPKLEKAAALRGLRLQTAFPEELPALCCDPRQLEAALRAAFDNALEWSPTEGEVRIAAVVLSGQDGRSRVQTVQIDVEDSGPGWPAEADRLLFLPYYSGRPAGRGLGVGLSKAWRFLRAAGGSVHLFRTAAGRTCTRLQLPSAPPRPLPFPGSFGRPPSSPSDP